MAWGGGFPMSRMSVTTKPWQVAKWKKAREEILKKVDHCEICGRKGTLVLHHSYEGSCKTEREFQRYMEPRRQDVTIMCKGCHLVWHKYGRLWCPGCGIRRRLPQYELCWQCATNGGMISNGQG